MFEYSNGPAVVRKETNCNFREPKQETEIETEFWNVNLYMETDKSDCHFWNIDPMKMWVLPLIFITSWLNS